MMQVHDAILCLAIFLVLSIKGLSRENNFQIEMASKHLNRIVKQAKCKLPLKRLVRINDLFPKESHKKYAPDCTMIHFCGPETGCCDESEKCSVKKLDEITLYFRVIQLMANQSNQLTQTIQSLTFQNHTECECQPVNKDKRLVKLKMY